MQISDSQAIMKSLKVFYKDGMKSLLERDGSAIKEVPFVKVEGKTYNISNIAGRGGAVAGNWVAAKAKAGSRGLQAEYAVEPGNIWATHTVLKNEIAAGKTHLGSYAPLLARGFYRSTKALRTALAASFYGRGYGEVGILLEAIASSAVDAEVDVKLTKDAIVKLDVEQDIVFKTNTTDAESSSTLAGEVIEILPGFSGVKIRVTKAGSASAGAVVCLAGSAFAEGSPILPMGLDGWLPIVNGRTGEAWNTYISQAFFAQHRKVASDRMAGYFYNAPASEKYTDSLINALYFARFGGMEPDIIIVNTEDRAQISKELTNLDHYYSATNSKAARKVNVGNEDFSVSAATNYVDLIVDDTFCPLGRFFIGNKSAWEYAIWFSKQDQNKDDGISTLEPGKQEPEDLESFNFDEGVSKLNIEDYITIQDGVDTPRGPGVTVGLGFMGALCVTDTSAWVTGVFAVADKTKVLGWQA